METTFMRMLVDIQPGFPCLIKIKLIIRRISCRNSYEGNETLQCDTSKSIHDFVYVNYEGNKEVNDSKVTVCVT